MATGMQQQILLEAVGDMAPYFIEYAQIKRVHCIAGAYDDKTVTVPAAARASSALDLQDPGSHPQKSKEQVERYERLLKKFMSRLQDEMQNARGFLESRVASLTQDIVDLETKLGQDAEDQIPASLAASISDPPRPQGEMKTVRSFEEEQQPLRTGDETSDDRESSEERRPDPKRSSVQADSVAIAVKQTTRGSLGQSYGAIMSSSLADDAGNNSLFVRSSMRASRVHHHAASRHAKHMSFVRVRALHTTVLKLQRFAILNAKIARQCALDFAAAHAPGDVEACEGVVSLVESALLANPLVTALPEIESLALRYEAFLNAAFPEDFATAMTTSSMDTGMLVRWHVKWRPVAAAVAVFVLLLVIPMKMPTEAHHCAAVLGLVTVLWVTEAIPFFVAAMLIPLVAAPLGVLPGKTRAEAGAILLAKTFDHTQILVMGGLCLGKALAKHKLETVASRVLLRRVAHRPNLYLLVVMVVAALACAFVSNVTAPLLMLSVIQPSLWELDRESGAPQAILLGLAFACNFGGMLSPIASPQNAVATQSIGFASGQSIGFETWLACALPLVMSEVVIVWLLLLLIWKPFKDIQVIPMPLGGHGADLSQGKLHRGYHAEASRKERIEVIIIIVTFFLTVVLWCVPKDQGIGDSGVIALIPIVTFFGMGILTKEDFNGLSWHLMFLLAGGSMLGHMAKESTLLEIVVSSMTEFWSTHSTFVVVLVLLLTMLLVASLVSHTVCSLIFLPLVAEVARTNTVLPPPSVLVYLAVQMASGAMAFPVTSFPNVNSILAEDAQGRPYLTVRNFLFTGTLASVTTLLHLISYMIPLTTALLPGRIDGAANHTVAPAPVNSTLW